MSPPPEGCKTSPVLFVLDLDGVVWLSGQPIAGAPEAVARLRAAGNRVLFLTNNSAPTLEEHAAALRAAGVEADGADVVSSAVAAGSLLLPGQRAVVVGGKGIRHALSARGIEVVDDGASPDAVVVGRVPHLDYDELADAATAIRAGARFVATNTDPTFPTPDGLLPGAGAVVAFLTAASGRRPEIAGKPHQAIARLVTDRFGQVDFVVGDRLDTDGAFAEAVGARFALVLSGATSSEDIPPGARPTLVADDLADAVGRVIGG